MHEIVYKGPRASDFYSMARKLKIILEEDGMSRERGLILSVDRGGYKIYPAFREALDRYNIPHLHYVLKQAHYSVENYRPILGIIENPESYFRGGFSRIISAKDIGEQARWVANLEDGINYGGSVAGAVIWAMENRKILGFEKYLFLVDFDNTSICPAHISRNKGFGNPKIIPILVHDLAHLKYQEIEKDLLNTLLIFDEDKIKQIDLEEKYIHSSLSELTPRLYSPHFVEINKQVFT